MPKTGIYKEGLLATKRTSKEKVFHCMLENMGTALSQSEIVKETKLSQPTVSRKLRELKDKTYPYGKYRYTVKEDDGLYMVIKEEDEKKIKEIRTNAIYTLADKKAFTAIEAKELTSSVVLFEMNKSYCLKTDRVLRSLYKSSFFCDIVSSNKGLYIIISEKISQEKIVYIKKELQHFYCDVVEQMKNNKELQNFSAKKTTTIQKNKVGS